ncbi:sensor histidine kinase [Deinococcus hohokamensis]|uniref:histidine kinase n=1 Tax=Deinococcus hohokamensis TaxID=309883 RepID=A0ABV9IAF7_9DEIO
MAAQPALWARLSHGPAGPWNLASWNLARQYSLASLVVLLASLLVLGWWVGRKIEAGVTHRAAAAAALYVENFIVKQVQDLPEKGWLSPAQSRGLGQLFSSTPFGQEVVSMKVWAPGGRIVYGDRSGHTFEVEPDQARAWRGEVASEISSLNAPENRHLRARYGRLLEIYTPIRREGSDQVIAVAEFYQTVSSLQREIGRAQAQSWAVVGSVMLLAYLLLSGLVRRGSNTIASQQAALNLQVAEQQALLAQNAELHDRVQRAATRIAEVHERVLARVSSGLHDGPAQDVSYALLRLDSLGQQTEHLDPLHRAQAGRDLDALEHSLSRAMRAMRDLATEVRLPDLHALSLQEALERAVRDHRTRTDSDVTTHWSDLPPQAPLPVKITAFRMVREALSNAYKHAGGRGQHVTAWTACAGGQGRLLYLEIRDAGSGFDVTRLDPEGIHLGLLSMRERTESLGGHFEVDSRPSGTVVRVRLPLAAQAEEL